MPYLGVDVGGSASRWAVCDSAGQPLGRGEAPGATGLVFDPASRDRLAGALAPIAAAWPGVTAAYLGMTGAGFADDPGLRALVAGALRLSPGQVRVVNDMVLAHQAVFPDGHGHLVSAGTGSVGFSMTGGRITLVGGRGTLIDDGGSAAWIALRALDTLWRRIDEHGHPRGAEGLAEALFTAMGGADWEDTRRFVYGQSRGEIGTLARAVAQAARAGDPLAQELMARAGDELARLARALVARCGTAPVAVIGGVLALHPAIRTRLEAGCPGLTLDFPQPDVPLAAARLALARG